MKQLTPEYPTLSDKAFFPYANQKVQSSHAAIRIDEVHHLHMVLYKCFKKRCSRPIYINSAVNKLKVSDRLSDARRFRKHLLGVLL